MELMHTGEIEVMDDDIGGMGVHIAARVSAKDLVAGSGLEFADRGAHELKGVPDTWELYAAAA